MNIEEDTKNEQNEQMSSENNTKKSKVSSDNESKISFNALKNKNIGKGSNNLHILPIKIKNDLDFYRVEVDKYFEKNIKENKDESKNYIEVSNIFRGRYFNGEKRKVSEVDNYGIKYVELHTDKNDPDLRKITNVEDVDNIYHWKFDEFLNDDENICNFDRMMKKFDILQ